MMSTINDDTFHLSIMNIWSGESGVSCHFTNNDKGMYGITDIDESIQVSSSIMPATKNGKLHVNVRQVDGTEWVHSLWQVKFCPMVGANLFSLKCELSQGKKIQMTTKTT